MVSTSFSTFNPIPIIPHLSSPHSPKLHDNTFPDPLRGPFKANIDGKPAVVQYDPDLDLRDTEQIPLQEAGGIDAFLEREVLPHAADAWYVESSPRCHSRRRRESSPLSSPLAPFPIVDV